MDIIAFFGSVWLAIGAGIFVLAMIIGCTADRNNYESGKWWVFFIGVILFTIYNWKNGYRMSLDTFLSADLWKFIGIYLLVGIGYSVIEFMLEVRRSARFWKEEWKRFYNENARIGKSDELPPNDVALKFVSRSYRSNYPRIIVAALNPNSKDTTELLQPHVNRKELAEHISVWIIFWPFYAVSLIIGDLVMEIARVLADVFAKISGRFVRMSFANVFKF